MRFKKLLIFLLCFCWGVVLAQDPPPLTLMKKVSNQTLSALRQNKSRLQDRRVIHSIVNRIVVPHFDLTGVARSVVGRNYWDQSSSATRNQFIKEFTRYVIDMYSSALSSYSDETITFKPMRGYSSSQIRVRIYSVVKRPGASPIDLDYRLVKIGNTWKIYDFSVNKVSMVQSYRAQFADTLKQSGLAGLTKQLQTRKR
jgi:phospholipid transport system substrate-binding protein